MKIGEYARLNKELQKIANALSDSEEFLTHQLASRLIAATENYPEDQTIRQMASFLNARSKKSLLITRAELKDVYNRLYSVGTRCGKIMSDELGINRESPVTYSKRDPKEGTLLSDDMAKMADPELVNALSAAFSDGTGHKLYSTASAKMAEKNCECELDRLGVKPDKVAVVAGQDDLLLCQASYNTPKGMVNMLVPVEASEGKALLPTIFLSDVGFKDLSKEAVENYLLSAIGKKFPVDVKKLLKTLSMAKNGLPEVVGDVEHILLKVKASRGSKPVDPNGIIGQHIDSYKEIKEAELEETSAFADRLKTAHGAAEFLLGKKTVDMGRGLVEKVLGSCGYKNVQISIADANKNTIFYAVAIDHGPGFKVPVKKVAGNKVELQGILISGGTVKELSDVGISEALAESDYKAAAVASPLYNLKGSELIDMVKEAVDVGNYLAAEEALNVLSNSGDAKAFMFAFAIYNDALNGKSLEKTASTKTQCSMQIKTSSSKYVTCGHTGLPIHKVYQDENGDCRPLYRKNLKESDYSPSFIYSKVYFE